MSIFSSKKEDAFRLRRDGLSYSAISGKLGIANSTLSTWFKDETESLKTKEKNIELAKKIWSRNISAFNKKRALEYNADRQKEEESYSRQLPKIDDKALMWLGIGLFVAEGSKCEKWSVRFANSDPVIIVVIMKFFRKICKVEDYKFRLLVSLHANCDEESSLKYWSEVASIPREQFWKSHISLPSSSLRKRPSNRLPFGTLRISIKDTQLNRKLKGWISGLKTNI